MRNVITRSVLAAGFFVLAGNVYAVKSVDSLTGSANQVSTERAIEIQDVLNAVNEVCAAWNTASMPATLHPDFPDLNAFIFATSQLPRNARLVLIEMGQISTTASDATVDVLVAIEYSENGSTRRDTPRKVKWTFKRKS